MDLREIEELIKAGESDILELKSSTSNMKNIAQTLCGFLNGAGGSVLIGITDKQEMIGQEVADKTRIEISNMLQEFEPTANVAVHYIDLAHKKKIIAMSTYPDTRSVPYCFDGRPYERQQADTRIMSQTRYQQLLLRRNMKHITWESLPAIGVSIGDLDKEEIIRTLKEGIKAGQMDILLDTNDPFEILTRFKLIKSGVINNAAVALFTQENIPGDYMQCVIRMARFKGLKKENFLDKKTVFGNAFHLLREAERFIFQNTAIAARFEEGKMERIDELEYPHKAVREALINALVHREYGSPGSSIAVMIYDDRLEIANTGLLPDGITINELKGLHMSHPRNNMVINVFNKRGLIEAVGMGTQQIVQSCLDAGMKEPDFYEQAGAFVIRIWSKHYQSEEVVAFSIRQKKILHLLKNKNLSPKEILEGLEEDITDRTLRRELILLKKEGYLEVAGQTRKAYWFRIK